MSTDFIADIAWESGRRATEGPSDFVAAFPGPRPSYPYCGGGRPACPSVWMRKRSRVREAAGRSGRREAVRAAWCPGTPAFWSAAARAAGGPASHHRRGRAGVDWGAATAPLARRRPASWRGKPHRDGVPRGLPGWTLCGAWNAAGRASQAQCRTRHAPKSARSPRALKASETAIPAAWVAFCREPGTGCRFG